MSFILLWINVNNLMLNSKEIKCIEFVLPNVTKQNSILINKRGFLYITESTEFLGITIDSKLLWNSHLETLENKPSSAVKKVRQMAGLLYCPTYLFWLLS